MRRTPVVRVPATLAPRTPLNPVQEEALIRAKDKRGYGWFLDMGLGKTLAALEEFRQLAETRVCQRLVVIAPNSFKAGWLAEVRKHGYQFDVHVFESTKRAKALAWMRKAHFPIPPVLIVNYEALQSEKTMDMIAEFADRKFAYLVLDESIQIKNHNAKRTKRILSMAPLFTRIRCLTGRPMTQGPHDMWAQLRVIGAYNRNYFGFRNTFCRMGGWMGKEILGSQNEDYLQRIMDPYVFQASKADWLASLPPKSYVDRYYELGAVLGPRYREMERDFLVWLRALKRVEVTVVIAQYQKLLQLQCGFVHDEEGKVEWLVADAENPRLNLLLETLEETKGKVCIAYSHKAVGVQLANTFPDAAHIHGGMRPAEIEEQKDQFNDDADCDRILLQVDASKYGHTLVGRPGDICSTMIFHQSSYSLDTRTQLEDRIHRIGQPNACTYVDFIGTQMDRHMIHALQRKQSIYEAVMGDGGIRWGR